MCVCVCVCLKNLSVVLSQRARERDSACVHVREWLRVSPLCGPDGVKENLCACERERGRERERKGETSDKHRT